MGADLGWHPCLRYQAHVTFQPEGQSTRVPVRTLISGPGDLWVGTGRAFRDDPLEGTLIVLHAYGQAKPWVRLTDTPVAQTEPTLYACRNWIEQGFRGMKTVGDPCMVDEGSSPWRDRPWGPWVRVRETGPEPGAPGARHARVFPEPVQLPGSKIRAWRARGQAVRLGITHPVMRLQQQAYGQQAGRYAAPSMVLAIEGREVLIPKHLPPPPGQPAVETVPADQIQVQMIRFKQTALI